MAAAGVPLARLDPFGSAGGCAEDRLAALARASGPLRRVMAALACRLVDGCRGAGRGGEKAEKGWERLGYASLADYARERLGTSARMLQELARVGRALEGLPGLEVALVSGTLPWSKLRLLARFVTAEDEGRWIAHAREVTVRTLERTLRRVDRGALETGALATDEEGASREPLDRIFVRGPASMCFKWQRAREYASRVSGARLPPGALLELVTAETLSALPLDAEAAEMAGADDAVPAPTGARRGPTAATVCAPHRAEPAPSSPAPLPPFLAPLLERLAGLDAFELDARLRRAVRLEQRLDAEVARALRVVVSPGYTWRRRVHTLEAFARERLGMSPRKARALLRLERLGDGCPALRGAFREGRLSWVRAQVLAPLLAIGPEVEGAWRQAWVAFASRVTVRALESAVGDALLARETQPELWQRLRGAPERFGAGTWGGGRSPQRQTCARTAGGLGAVRLQIRAPRDVARLFRAVLCSLRRALERESGGRRLPSEGEAFDAMLDHALESWGADDPWLAKHVRRQHRVFERDGWRCSVPGCSARRNLHAHHVVFRSQGGSDALENQTTLCAVHHQRGVHAGRLRITGSAPGGLVYELGLRPGLPPLERYRSGDIAA